ncbi:unnamed protein product [Fusarium graminearum]|uniref:Uncharacterized protein n=2 Tax=Gibberella zeae TaxID=5518 RepID=A0A4U9EY57_GIBZA|nr:unnamed protein product [Fusarium graminearum]CAF3495323.1 unnamed protein product [Fusarium graminearum]CAG1979488.1 unnamed protein product [Fusarium graminearum]CZS73787.1 unnamed protein product [Fusarium graminearum]VTO85652.1 unnamed protein product [Fusarium graminearum]
MAIVEIRSGEFSGDDTRPPELTGRFEEIQTSQPMRLSGGHPYQLVSVWWYQRQTLSSNSYGHWNGPFCLATMGDMRIQIRSHRGNGPNLAKQSTQSRGVS